MLSTDSDIPTITYARLVSTESTVRATERAQLIRGFETFGFVYLYQPPVDSTLIAHGFAKAKDFFAKDARLKESFGIRGPTSNFGFSPIGDEQVNPQSPADHKEGLNLDNSIMGNPYKPEVAALWGAGFASFQSTYQHLFTAFCAQTHTILNALDTVVGQKEGFLHKLHDHNEHSLRLLRYPTTATKTNSRFLSAGEHTDYGTLTFLYSNQPGLEIRTIHGTWIPVPIRTNCAIVNIGDVIELLTAGRFRSTPHRVVANEYKEDRYSIAFFCHPNADSVLKPYLLPQDPTTPFPSEEIVFAQFMQAALTKNNKFMSQY